MGLPSPNTAGLVDVRQPKKGTENDRWQQEQIKPSRQQYLLGATKVITATKEKRRDGHLLLRRDGNANGA